MNDMAKAITSRWWLPLLDGVLAILFGLLAWVWPGLTILTLVVLFGAYAFVSGVVNLGAAFHAQRLGHSPWYFVLRGVLGIGAGIVVWVWTGISALALLYVIAIWAIVTGIFEAGIALEMRRQIEHAWLLGLAGIASIMFGVLVAFFPGAGAVALVWTIGIYAIVIGVLLVALGFRLRSVNRALTSVNS